MTREEVKEKIKNEMSAKELIEVLKELDPNSPVIFNPFICDYGSNTFIVDKAFKCVDLDGKISYNCIKLIPIEFI